MNLPEGLGEEAKRYAAQRGCTFTALVVEGLQLVVGGAPEGGPCSALPSYGGGHLLVDLADKAAVGGALDADGMR